MEKSKALESIFDLLAENPVTRIISKAIDRLGLPKNVIKDLFKLIFGGTESYRLQKGLFLVGSIFILHKIIRGAIGIYTSLNWLPKHYGLQSSFDEKEFRCRYGNDCWVLITGFTAGMGLAYAKSFASMGFNLVLVGRNKEKIKYALRWIGQYNDQILTKVIDLDLTADPEVLYNTLKEQTQDVDVGIVINNAGASSYGNFEEIPRGEHVHTYKMNVSLAVEVCRVFVPRMRSRERSAIVNVGSGMSVFPAPTLGIYPATKRYIELFTESLLKENGNIDVLLMTPLGVSTDMMAGFKGPYMVTPEEVVRQTILNLGRTSSSFGAARHKISQVMLSKLTQEQRFALLKGNFARMIAQQKPKK